MNLPTELLVAAAEALRSAEAQDQNIQGFKYGHLHLVRDVSKPNGQQKLWEQAQDGDTLEAYNATHAAMLAEIEAINMARRIMAVARVVAEYERNRVWKAAHAACSEAKLPNPASAPPIVAEAVGEMTPMAALVSGAETQLLICMDAIETAARAELGAIPLEAANAR